MLKRPLALAVLLAVWVPAIARAQAPVLAKILEDVRSAYNRQERPMVIFDLEGTLMDNRSRHLQIIKEYGEQELKSVRPEAAQKLAVLTLPMVSYMLTDTLAAAGVNEPAVVNNAAVFWSQRFFTDEYLKYDQPTPGAVGYVRTLYSNGARIVYLTGRDAPRQLLGTAKQLRDNGFPIGIQGTELIMKPTAQTQDAIFKQQVTAYLRHFGKVVATFDNEPANANVYRRAFADAAVVVYASSHTPNPPPLLPGITPLAAFE
ncbi:MAG: hypothetical protein AAB426_15235 [Myxococcota bacterium]